MIEGAVLLLAFAGVAVTAVATMLSALMELAPEASPYEVLAKGIFAGEDRFTRLGWRRRNRAIVLHAIAGVLLIAWVAAR